MHLVVIPFDFCLSILIGIHKVDLFIVNNFCDIWLYLLKSRSLLWCIVLNRHWKYFLKSLKQVYFVITAIRWKIQCKLPPKTKAILPP